MDNVLTGYRAHLVRLPLSGHTKRNYLLRIRGFLEWLVASTPDPQRALADPVERDFVVRDYRAHLLHQGRQASTINAILTALDSLYTYIGIGNPRVRRHDLPQQAPKALSAEELRRLLRVIGHSSPRNRTMGLLLLHTGLRISELIGLNVGDVYCTPRKGELVVRCGKGDKQRRIPLNSEIREVLMLYMMKPRDPQEPLFISQKGNRMSLGAADHVIRQLARDAGIQMSCHTLRHSCISRLIRSGADIVLVAEIAGHSRLETTRRYSLPTQEDKVQAMELLTKTS